MVSEEQFKVGGFLQLSMREVTTELDAKPSDEKLFQSENQYDFVTY